MRAGSFAASAMLIGCVLVLPQAAHAADYLRGTQIDMPVEAPPNSSFGVPNWGGFYIGGSFAYSTARFDAERQSQLLSDGAFYRMAVGQQGSTLLRFGRSSVDKTGFGGFVGYNSTFGDVVLGIEAEYLRFDAQTQQSNSISRLYTDIFPTTVESSPSTEPNNTQTVISVNGQTTNRLTDTAIVKARAGYAMGNFMPYLSIGLAVGRVSTNATVAQTHRTTENYARFNTVSGADGTETRSTFIGNAALARPDASGGHAASEISSGYVPGIALGGGIEALLGENILLRAEFSRIYFADYKGVTVIADTARVGAGLKF